jgi:putative flippase GtrA
MADLTPSSGRVPSRREREKRAYRLVVVGGAAGIVAVAGLVLALLGVIGSALPVLAIVVTIICAVLFRRTVA